MTDRLKTITAICIFAIAMAALESAVVVYLRALYYPDGFSVALRLIDEEIVITEILREIATVIMLLSVSYLSAAHFRTRLAFFLLAFAVWDIFYYLWLKVFIGWPASLLDWDILFLIPFTWLAPVLAPVLSSMTMIFLAYALLVHRRPIRAITWALLIGGSALILFAFLENYGRMIIGNGFLADYPGLLRNEAFVELATSFTPYPFNWNIFLAGECCHLAAVASLWPLPWCEDTVER